MKDERFYYYDFSSLDMTANAFVSTGKEVKKLKLWGNVYGPFKTKKELNKSIKDSFNWVISEYRMACRAAIKDAKGLDLKIDCWKRSEG